MASTTSNKRKKAVAATVAAAAILLAGTFAWTSISQQALNESAGVVNVGGRLHDDFNGENKDIYVENFTDPLDGGQPIYARIRLDEYMEVGQEAGSDKDLDGDGIIEAVSVIDGAERGNVSTWETHIPTPTVGECATEGTHLIHEHWTWTMGNDAGTTYMPTFNKDKDSLEADRNGTYAGTNPTDKVYYDDYVEYAVSDGASVDLTAAFTPPTGSTTATALTETEGAVTSVKGTAYYDDDTNAEPNSHDPLSGAKAETETHKAKATQKGTVVLMADWDGTPGNYWVYDKDGWAYWAAPIMPGQATGLFLDGIQMTQNPGEKCYYGINAVAQFATVGDWGYFNDEKTPDQFDGTDEALALLEKAAATVPTITVSSNAGAHIETGTTAQFTATATIGEETVTNASAFNWYLVDENGNKIESSSISSSGLLSVSRQETNETLYVVAEYKDLPGAVGLGAVDVKIIPLPVYTLQMTRSSGAEYPGYVQSGETWNLTLLADGEESDEEVVWEMTQKTRAALQAGTGLASNGQLTIAPKEGIVNPDTVLTVTAKAKEDDYVLLTQDITIKKSEIGVEVSVDRPQGWNYEYQEYAVSYKNLKEVSSNTTLTADEVDFKFTGWTVKKGSSDVTATDFNVEEQKFAPKGTGTYTIIANYTTILGEGSSSITSKVDIQAYWANTGGTYEVSKTRETEFWFSVQSSQAELEYRLLCYDEDGTYLGFADSLTCSGSWVTSNLRIKPWNDEKGVIAQAATGKLVYIGKNYGFNEAPDNIEELTPTFYITWVD